MENKNIILRKTNKFGKGLFAKKDFRKDEIIIRFKGPILHYGDAKHYEHWTEDLHDHAVQVGETTWISNSGIGRYINHSCEPNCGIKKSVSIVAMRDIKKGEEVTYDYEMTENHGWRMKCKCGSKDCRNIIGAYKNMPLGTRKKYKSYISEWLLK